MDVDSKNTWTTYSGLGLILWYIGVRPKKYSDCLMDFNWFCSMLDLDLKNTWTNALDSNLFCYNQAGTLENLLELSSKQLVIQSNLESSISLGQTMYGVWKTKMLMLFVPN